MDRNAITEVLEWAYDKAVFSGIPEEQTPP